MLDVVDITHIINLGKTDHSLHNVDYRLLPFSTTLKKHLPLFPQFEDTPPSRLLEMCICIPSVSTFLQRVFMLFKKYEDIL